jgi:hypothetical protein
VPAGSVLAIFGSCDDDNRKREFLKELSKTQPKREKEREREREKERERWSLFDKFGVVGKASGSWNIFRIVCIRKVSRVETLLVSNRGC